MRNIIQGFVYFLTSKSNWKHKPGSRRPEVIKGWWKFQKGWSTFIKVDSSLTWTGIVIYMISVRMHWHFLTLVVRSVPILISPSTLAKPWFRNYNLVCGSARWAMVKRQECTYVTNGARMGLCRNRLRSERTQHRDDSYQWRTMRGDDNTLWVQTNSSKIPVWPLSLMGKLI